MIGAPHHLANPEQALRQISAILTVGDIYYGVENNKSACRGIFDFLMSIKPLWIEEASAKPQISAAMIDNWAHGLSARVTSETVYSRRPTLFNLLGLGLATGLLCVSDRFCVRSRGCETRAARSCSR